MVSGDSQLPNISSSFLVVQQFEYFESISQLLGWSSAETPFGGQHEMTGVGCLSGQHDVVGWVLVGQQERVGEQLLCCSVSEGEVDLHADITYGGKGMLSMSRGLWNFI